MKIKKGMRFKCIKDVAMSDGKIEFSKGKVYESQGKGYLINNNGWTHHITHDFAAKHFTRYYSLEDLKNGVVALENDGGIGQIKSVMRHCFGVEIIGTDRYYSAYGSGWACWSDTDLPTQSVKDFYEQLPVAIPENKRPTQEIKDKLDRIAEEALIKNILYGKSPLEAACRCKVDSLPKHDTLGHIEQEIEKALTYAETKHPKWPKSKFKQFSILTEEVGEVAKALNDGDLDEAKEELHQVGAMVLRMLKNWK